MNDTPDPRDALIETLAGALSASLDAADSHYAHWDSKGTAGANCPACHARRAANDTARTALAAHAEWEKSRG